MNRFIILLVTGTVVMITALVKHWTDPFHFFTGGLVLLLTGVLSAFWMRTHAPVVPKGKTVVRATSNPIRATALGLTCGIVISLACGASFSWLGRWSGYVSLFYDDESRIVRTLENTKGEAAVELLEKRLQGKASARLRLKLHAWLYDALVEAGEHARSAERRRDLLRTAVHVATTNGLSAKLAESQLAHLESVLGQMAKEHEFQVQLDALRIDHDWEKIATLMQAELTKRIEPTRAVGFAKRLYEAQLELAKTTPDASVRERCLREAIATAHAHRLHSGEAEALRQRDLAVASESADLETRLEVLVSQQKWPALAARLQILLADTPKERRNSRWPAMLFNAQLRLGDSSPGDSQVELYRTALETARAYGLDGTVASNKLQTLRAARAEREAFAAQVEALRSRRSWDELSALARAAIPRPREQWPAALDELLHGSLLQRGDAAALEQRRAYYEQALSVAQQYHLDASPAKARLARLAEEVRENETRRELAAAKSRPADLPSGSRAGISRFVTDSFPPSFVVELWVEDRQGQAVPGLTAKDFQITCQGVAPKSVALAAIQGEAPRLHVVIALDCSGSMQDAMPDAIAAVQALLRGLHEEASVSVKVIKFGNDVRTVCDWTDAPVAAMTTIGALRAGGDTALFEAAAQAGRELENRSGERRLILFTDGRNTVGRSNSDLRSLTAHLQQARVSVTAVGLNRTDLDRATLQTLASSTAGTFLVASNSTQLTSTFHEARLKLRRTLHRFVVTPESIPTASPLPVRIRIGNNHSIELEDAIPVPSLAAARK